jgi:hypothetical protein
MIDIATLLTEYAMAQSVKMASAISAPSTKLRGGTNVGSSAQNGDEQFPDASMFAVSQTM